MSIPHVVVVNYASHHLLPRLIASLTVPHRLVVVDNFSSHTELEELRRVLPSNSVLLTSKNTGFAAGVNTALRSIDPSAPVVLLNPDAWFAEGAFAELLDQVYGRRLDVATPQILDGTTSKVWFAGGAVHPWTGSVSHHHFGRQRLDDGIAPTQFVSGCALYLSPRARRVVGDLNERLFMYFEDAELSARALGSGLQLWVVKSAIAYHEEGSTSRSRKQTKSPLFYRYQARNRLRANLHAPSWRRRATTPWVYFLTAARIVKHETHAAAALSALTLGTVEGLGLRADDARGRPS